MARRLRRSLSFANVCSLLALFVAVSTGGAYAANTVFSTDIVDGEVKTPDLALSAVGAPQLAQGAVNSSRIANGTIVGADMALGAIGEREIADESVAGVDIGPDAVGPGEVADDSLGQADLATDSVGPLEVATGAIDGGEVADESLRAADIGVSAVGTSELAANAVNSDKVINNALTANDVKGAYSAGTVGLSAGAVSAGRCRDFNIGVPAARPGEAVVISTRGPLPQGVVFYGVGVPFNDIVTMKVCNFSGAASPQLDSIPIRTITFG